MKTMTVKEARQYLRKAIGTTSDEALDFGTRQTNPEEGLYTNAIMESFNLLSPPYDPFRLYTIMESSGTLGACVEVMVDNVDGFGYELQYRGDKDDLKNDDVIQERYNLKNFFKRVNETQSFTSLRKELRRDYETTGNAYMEIVRFNDSRISTLYRADARYVRLRAKQKEPTDIEIPLYRNGKLTNVKIQKRFRKFAMITNTSSHDIRWFKEYGDPRKMCAVTGKYEEEIKEGEEIKVEASEIIHFKQGNDTYGIPKWVGISSTVLGVRDADYVNYKLFSDQGIPPLAILVSGGRLTQDSVEDLINIFKARKGVENFHKIAILEAAPAEGDIDDIASQAKIDFKPLPQQNDILFENYINQSEKRIRSKFRIPALYLGLGEEFSRSTSQNIKLIVEEQVFGTERNDFDEMINFTLMYDLGATKWKFRSVGPKLIEGADAIDAVGKFARAGSLTINQAIKVMNRVLDLDAPLYNQEWADYPAAMVLELTKKGWIKDAEEIADFSTAVNTVTTEMEKAEMAEDFILTELKEIREELENLKHDRPLSEVLFK